MATLDPMPFSVEEWLPDGSAIVEVLARGSNYPVACGAYQAAVALRPKARIILRNGIRIVADSAEVRARRAV